jgi:hypothetical protein
VTSGDGVRYLDFSAHPLAYHEFYGSQTQNRNPTDSCIYVRKEYSTALTALHIPETETVAVTITGQPGIGAYFMSVFMIYSYLFGRENIFSYIPTCLSVIQR